MRLPRLSRGEWLVAAGLLALAVAPLAGLLVRVWSKGGLVTAGDGFLMTDQLQYLNWLRQASDHVLVENLYDLEDGPRSFLHPGILAAGLLHALGLGLVASYSVWKIAGVAVLFAGVLALVRRFLDRPGDRLLALALALFATAPVSAAVGFSGAGSEAVKLDLDFIGGELWAGTWLWGYMFTAVAVGLVPLAILAYERDRTGWAAAAGLLCTWLQPWQGATLAIVLLASETLLVRRGARDPGEATRRLVPVGVAIALPAAYYWLLSRLDSSWELAQAVNELPRWPLWAIAVTLAPLALPAALAYRLPAPDLGHVALRVWPLAALLVYALPFGTFPFHAFQGLGIPLVVLAVIALRAHLGERAAPAWAVAAVLVVMIVPGTAYRASELRDAVNRGFQAFFMEPEERDALRWLDDAPEGGGVLTTVYLGTAVPAYTGRETWIGAGSWTPDFDRRLELAERLFGGRMDALEAERFVRSTGARFLFSDCHGRAGIDAIVERVAEPAARFGCATVYRVR